MFSFHQTPLPLGPILHRRLKPLQRRARRPFTPRTVDGPYQLPRAVQEPLGAALTGFRNAEAAWTLAAFLGRYWSTPGRLDIPFPIDRRALVGHPHLGLSENEVRGAILTLERVGFLERVAPGKGSGYRVGAEGELRRKPILFAFGAAFLTRFREANTRAKARTHKADARAAVPRALSHPKAFVQTLNVLTGGLVERLPRKGQEESDPKLEAAIHRWKAAFDTRHAEARPTHDKTL